MWIVGLALVIIAGYCGYQAYHARKSIQRMTSTQTYTSDDIAAMRGAAVTAGSEGAFAKLVEVKGVVRIGPAGPLTSQLTGTECAWHRHKVERKYKDTYRDSDGHRRTRNKTQTLTSHRTEDTFYVEDSTGKILVRPTVVVHKAKKVLDQFEEPAADKQAKEGGFLATVGKIAKDAMDDEDTIGFRRREWVLKDGARVYVLGEASDADGDLVVGAPSDGSDLMITTRTEEQLSEEKGKKGVLNTAIAAIGGLIGVVLLVISGVQQLL